MDNQQALSDQEIAWLCGFFDGEGHVGMNISGNYSAMKKKSTRRLTIIVPRIIFTNTHYPTVIYIRDLLNRANIGVHVSTGRRGSEKHKPIYRAIVNGHKRCLKVLPILVKFSVTKKRQLEIISAWLKHRQENYHYSLKDYEFYLELSKEISSKGPNDSTLRRLYESCTAEFNPLRGGQGAWMSRRKIESGHIGNDMDY